jgi:hypothetical protein
MQNFRMTCHGYGRMDKVTHEMQPRFIHSPTSRPVLRGFRFHFDGGAVKICPGLGPLAEKRGRILLVRSECPL